MKQLKRLSELIFITVFVIFLPYNGYSQSYLSEDTDTTGSQNKTSSTSANSLYLGAGAGSNLIYLGSIISRTQPFTFASLTYAFNNELSVSVSGVHLPGIYPYMPFYSGSMDYSHVFNSWFDINARISGNRFASSLADSLLTSFIYGDFTLGIDSRIIYTKITIGGMLSDESNLYFQVRNSRYFKTTEFGKHRVFLSFDPYINVIGGTYLKSEYNTIISGGKGMEYGAKSTQSSIAVSWSSHFGLIEYDIGLPVAVNMNRFRLEVEGGYVLPAYSDPELPGPKGFVFMISGSMKIF